LSDPIDFPFLPAAYLKRWASPGDGKIVHYKRVGDRIVTSRLSPAKSGYGTGFEGTDADAGSTVQARDGDAMTRLIDHKAEAAFSALIAAKGAPLPSSTTVPIILFLLSLCIRQWEADKPTNDGAAAAGDASPSPPLADYLRELTPGVYDDFALLQTSAFREKGDFASRLAKWQWRVVDCTAARTDFLTGDRPLYLEGALNLNPDARCIIAFPVSPRLSLLISTHSRLMNRAMAGTLPDMVARLNELTVSSARERVFGTGDHHRALVEKFRPGLKDFFGVPGDER